MTHIALLRAVNVAGSKPLSMAALRDFAADLGFTNVQTLLQSGNLLFDGARGASAKIESLLESEAAKRLAIQTDFFVRTATEWRGLVAANPFRAEAERDPARLVLVVLKKAPAANDVSALKAAIAGPEVVRADGRQLYITYPNGQGRSRLTNALIEKKLATRGTARNWNTVLKLAAAAGGPSL